MLKKVWRTSHLLLALIAGVFLLLASVTGIILAFEPIQKELQPYRVRGAEKVTLSNLLKAIDGKYETVLEIEVLENNALKIATIDSDEHKDGDFIIDPNTGAKLGDLPEKNPFFQTITNFHRSLFLKSTGRFLIGLTAFLFLLSIITGLLLLINREGGIKAIYPKTIKTKADQYLHVIISKWSWLPLLVVALSGVYLSLLRFEVVPEPSMMVDNHLKRDISLEEMPIFEFDVFQNLTIGEIQKIEFPFSENEEDPFVLHLHHKRWMVQQYNGQILEAFQSPFINIISGWSFRLHTGTGSILWSIVIGVSTTGVLFLMFSGFSIAYQRTRIKLPQHYPAEEAETVILFGTENGSTKSFANALYKSLIDKHQKAFITELNKYQVFPNLKNLVVLTSTYGEGTAPNNADQFLELFNQQPIEHSFSYGVLGFGSRAYPHFCQFANEIQQLLFQRPNATKILDLMLIHNQSQSDFLEWSKRLSQQLKISIEPAKYLKVNIPKLDDFLLVDRRDVEINGEHRYLITLQPKKKYSFQSGDLLNIYPKKDPVKRSYSISKDVKGRIQLAIKRHEIGIVSNYLFQLPIQSRIKAKIQINKHFHFPTEAKSVVLIGNGTGMGPFLGMIQHNQNQPIVLYWGGRSRNSFELYRPYLEEALVNGKLSNLKTAFSREENQQYVQDIVKQDGAVIANELGNGACIMICGSIAMQKDVLKVLNTITNNYLAKSLEHFIEKDQLKMDCY